MVIFIRMRHLFSVLVLTLLLAICVSDCGSYSPNAINIQIDASFSEANRQLIIESLDDWQTQTNNTFHYESVSYIPDLTNETEYNTIKFINKDIEKDTLPGTTITEVGLTNWVEYTTAQLYPHIQATVFIWDNEPESIFAPTARHEIGHAVLLGHYCNEAQAANIHLVCQVVADTADWQPSIMTPVLLSGVNVVEPKDVERFCQVWSCH